MTLRSGGRGADALRHLRITRNYTMHAEGSVLIEAGNTKVLCTASVEEGVPAFLKGKGQGWLTAEYGMLPRATNTRMRREAAEGRQSGRTQEIQRLIGRSLRAVTDLTQLGERTLKIDCDVLQADGGTRCASITGAYVAVADAIAWCRARGLVTAEPLTDFVAAVASAAFCAAISSRMPRSASATSSSISARVNGAPSAVPCSSTKPPAPVITTFMSVSQPESSA